MALGTSNRDGGKTSESGHLRTIQKMIVGEVLEGLNVTQKAGGANMSVDIQIGDAIIPRSDGTYGHPAWADAVYNQVIATADVTNPRRDIIVMYIDYDEAPSTAVSNNTNGVVKIKAVAGTPAGSPSDPSDVAIQASVGSGNPYIKLARVRVAAAVPSISDSVIDDLRSMATSIESTNSLASLFANTLYDFIESGLVITGDSLGVNKNYSISAGYVWLNGKRLSVAAVSAQTVAASKDRYIDVHDNGDNTAVFVTTEVNNNAASPALAAGNIRIGIVVAGATTIAGAGSINQGENNKVLPIASSIPYSVTDSLGNLIANRSPLPRKIGYGQRTSDFTQGTTTSTQLYDVGVAATFKIPEGGRSVKATAWCPWMSGNVGSPPAYMLSIREGSTVLGSAFDQSSAANNKTGDMTAIVEKTLAPGTYTWKVSAAVNQVSNLVVGASNEMGGTSDAPLFLLIEID